MAVTNGLSGLAKRFPFIEGFLLNDNEILFNRFRYLRIVVFVFMLMFWTKFRSGYMNVLSIGY